MQGSIPRVGFGSAAFFSIVLVLARLAGLNLSIHANSQDRGENADGKIPFDSILVRYDGNLVGHRSQLHWMCPTCLSP
jgi:hypothetical protein